MIMSDEQRNQRKLQLLVNKYAPPIMSEDV